MGEDPESRTTAELKHGVPISEVPLEIRTERLFMRRLVAELDADDIFDIRSRMDVMKWSSTKIPDADVAATKGHFLNFNRPGALGLTVFEASNSNRAIACIGFYKRNGRTDLGYLVHPDCWGKGYATEAAKAAIDIWWEFVASLPPENNSGGKESPKSDLVLHAVTDSLHVASHRVLMKCGFKQVGKSVDEPQSQSQEEHDNETVVNENIHPMASYISGLSSSPPSPPSPPLTMSSTTSQPDETTQSQSQKPQGQQTLQPSKKPLIPNSTKLLIGGTAFLILSSIITRRALLRKRISALPPIYTSAPFHQPPVNGALEALEALNIATINVASVAMIGVGAGMYAFDINTMEDLRRKVRGGLGVDGSGRSEQDVEEELEEWVVTVMGRKAEKEKKGREGEREYVNERGKDR